MEPLIPTEETAVVAPAPESERPLGQLEVLNRGGRVTQRIALGRNPVRIGRAYDNEVVIDDPFVSPHHALLEWSDVGIRIIDHDSLNGIRIDGRGRVTDSELLRCGDLLHLGHTQLRFRSAAFALSPTRRDGRVPTLPGLFEQPLLRLASFLLVFAVLLLGNYLETVREFELLKALPGTLFPLSFIPFWALGWSFASRIMIQRWNFWPHCSIAATGMLLLLLTESLISYFVFAFDLDAVGEPLDYLFSYLVIAAVLYFSLLHSSATPPRQLLKSSIGVATLCIALLLVTNLARFDDFDNEPVYAATFKAPFFRLSGGESSADFFAATDLLLERVAEEVAEQED
ncbi:MAG: hypothetical protein C0622_10235 [Desulfuromonas sp.]|nr:MAG: hypothetical protein C0622_10235 [Desulfuromonas sp.]